MEEFERWIKQAKADLDTAEYNLKGKKYYVCANYSQQVVEKLLKAVIIKDKRKLIKTHSITKMAKMLELPKKLIFKISELEPVQQESKYPDVSSKLPFEEYDEQDANEFLNTAEEVLIWVTNKLK
ncbi:MAG: HEPN domain-containing protein [Nanoarchaeota archaeon]|nr:HEPN domain-containing protein [Nanoarchaeota archaeon]MBU4116272.1 HEPN domain-containing protein [Nanoarchaeota archaeon]